MSLEIPKGWEQRKIGETVRASDKIMKDWSGPLTWITIGKPWAIGKVLEGEVIIRRSSRQSDPPLPDPNKQA